MASPPPPRPSPPLGLIDTWPLGDRLTTTPILLTALARLAQLTDTNRLAIYGFDALFLLCLLLAYVSPAPLHWIAAVYGK
jgi:hypothetical protein